LGDSMDEKSSARRVLVVDDDPGICKLLKDALNREGYETDAAGSPREAIKLAGERDYGLVFLDIRMPEMNGLELAARIKEQNPEREIVFITGHESYESALQAIKLGAYDYLRKPFNLSELNLCLKRYQEKYDLRTKARSAERRYYDLVQNIPLLIWVLGPDLDLHFVNDAARGMLGYTTDEALKTRGWFLGRIHPDDREPIERLLRKAFTSEAAPFSSECRVLHKNGTTIHTILKSFPRVEARQAEDGREVLEGVIVDITDRVLLEKAIVQREKLKTLGAISAEVAHEIRNPLTSIGGFAQRLKDKRPDLAEGEIILKESRRLERLLDRIRDYLRPVEIQPTLCSVNELVRYSTELLENEFEQRRVKVRLALKEDLPRIQADPDILTQVFINLARTSLQSMESGDELIFRSSESDRNIQVTVRCRVPERKFRNLDGLFLPFDEEGQSLGLPHCYKLIRKMGGLLSSEREGDELVFTASFPKRS